LTNAVIDCINRYLDRHPNTTLQQVKAALDTSATSSLERTRPLITDESSWHADPARARTTGSSTCCGWWRACARRGAGRSEVFAAALRGGEGIDPERLYEDLCETLDRRPAGENVNQSIRVPETQEKQVPRGGGSRRQKPASRTRQYSWSWTLQARSRTC
jgi:hypothetical protein